MANSTTIKISNEVREKLTELKLDNEGYSVVIARIIEENKALREDKANLYKMVLRTSDSVAFPNNIHRATYVITRIISDIGINDSEKFELMKANLSEMLETDPTSIIDTIANLKEMLILDKVEVPSVLIDFESYVRELSS